MTKSVCVAGLVLCIGASASVMSMEHNVADFRLPLPQTNENLGASLVSVDREGGDEGSSSSSGRKVIKQPRRKRSSRVPAFRVEPSSVVFNALLSERSVSEAPEPAIVPPILPDQSLTNLGSKPFSAIAEQESFEPTDRERKKAAEDDAVAGGKEGAGEVESERTKEEIMAIAQDLGLPIQSNNSLIQVALRLYNLQKQEPAPGCLHLNFYQAVFFAKVLIMCVEQRQAPAQAEAAAAAAQAQNPSPVTPEEQV